MSEEIKTAICNKDPPACNKKNINGKPKTPVKTLTSTKSPPKKISANQNVFVAKKNF